MVEALEHIASHIEGMKFELSQLRQGYDFARELVRDVRAHCALVLKENGTPITNLGLVLHLAEYQFALDDVSHLENNPHSAGVALYGIIHKKNHRFLTTSYSNLAKSAINAYS